MRCRVVVFVGLVLAASQANAQNYRANTAESVDGDIRCLWARDRIITVVSGPCEKFTPPRQIKVGDAFSANGSNKVIKVLLATRVEKDLPSVNLKAGDWYCTAAETAKDIPSLSGKSDHTGTWIYIPKCKPID